MTEYFIEVIDRSTGEITKRHGPMRENEADRREATLLDRLNLKKVDVRVMEVKVG